MAHPYFQPSVYERPLLRFRFLTPDGQAHQATLTTDNPGSSAYFSGPSPQAQHRRLRLTEALARLCSTSGCSLHELDMIGSQTLEITRIPEKAPENRTNKAFRPFQASPAELNRRCANDCA